MANKKNNKNKNNTNKNSNKSVSMKKEVIIKNKKEDVKEEKKKLNNKEIKKEMNKISEKPKKEFTKKVKDDYEEELDEILDEELEDKEELEEIKETNKYKNEKLYDDFEDEEEFEDNYEDILNEKEDKLFKSKYFIYVLLIPVILLLILSFTYKEEKLEDELNYVMTYENETVIYNIENQQYVESEEETDLVKIEVKDKGIMVAELYPDVAPKTVENFKKLVSEGFYDGLTFHRVIEDFVIQTGDPTATGTGGSDETIEGEFEENGFENNLSHTRGVLSMARQGSDPETEETMNSASSQFFIVHNDSTSLDGKYAAFGKVIYGLDVLDKVATVSTDDDDKPTTDQVISSIKFVTPYSSDTTEVE